MRRTGDVFNTGEFYGGMINATIKSRKPMLRQHFEHGFSLIEIMVALAIMAIILSIAVPSYNEMKLSMGLRANANNLIVSIQLARSEAIKSNATVRLCASNNGTSCAGTWSDGWVVLNAANAVIQRQQAITTGYTLTEANGLTTLNFRPTGIGATQASLTLCRKTPSVGTQERVIAVSVTGKPSVKKTTTGTCS